MRPTPTEELRAIRRVLADVVAPAVSEEYAAAQVQHIVGALERLETSWERAADVLAAENAALEQLFGDLYALIVELPGAGSLAGEIAAAAPGPGGQASFANIHSRNQALRGILDRAIAVLDQAGELPAAGAARAAIRDTLRANLERALHPPGS
jgi:hypothetical protein